MLAALCNPPAQRLRRRGTGEARHWSAKLVSVFHVNLTSFPIYFDVVCGRVVVGISGGSRAALFLQHKVTAFSSNMQISGRQILQKIHRGAKYLTAPQRGHKTCRTGRTCLTCQTQITFILRGRRCRCGGCGRGRRSGVAPARCAGRRRCWRRASGGAGRCR